MKLAKQLARWFCHAIRQPIAPPSMAQPGRLRPRLMTTSSWLKVWSTLSPSGLPSKLDPIALPLVVLSKWSGLQKTHQMIESKKITRNEMFIVKADTLMAFLNWVTDLEQDAFIVKRSTLTIKDGWNNKPCSSSRTIAINFIKSIVTLLASIYGFWGLEPEVRLFPFVEKVECLVINRVYKLL